MQQPRRIAFLDGLRGVASLQVVALHYASAFFPAIGLIDASRARQGWEALFINSPLFLAVDGYSAVYVFFLISGVVLTYSFQGRPWAIGAGTVRRLIRLGVPMAASVVFAACLLWLIPQAHVAAGHASGSDDWMVAIGPADLGVRPILREVLLGGMLAGHVGSLYTMLPDGLAAALQLAPAAEAFNAPLRTLHFELYGSILLLWLVAARTCLGGRNHVVLCAILLVVLTAHPLSFFVIGHLLAPLIASPRWSLIVSRGATSVIGLAAICVAMMLASYLPTRGIVDPLIRVGDFFALPGRLNDFHVQSSVVALLVFAGVLMTLPIQRVLLSRPCQWLGRISFGLYLTHFPLLFTISAWFYAQAGGHGDGALLAIAAGAAVTIPAACLFEASIDRLAIRLSHRIPRSGSWLRRLGPGRETAREAGTDA